MAVTSDGYALRFGLDPYRDVSTRSGRRYACGVIREGGRTLVVTAGLSATQETLGDAFPIPEFILQILNLVISLGVITVLFALIFKFLPDARIGWRDVWMGALVTSLLFSLGKTVIGLHLGNSAVGSTFGAAGSLVLLLLWIYRMATRGRTTTP